jgi:hypothetical protein
MREALGRHDSQSVKCKGCGATHYFWGFQDNVPWKYVGTESLIAVFCPNEKRMYEYDFDKDETIFTTRKVTIVNLEDKILKTDSASLSRSYQTFLKHEVEQAVDEQKQVCQFYYGFTPTMFDGF